MKWYRLDEKREISDLITCAEYQLFLDEMKAVGECYQPEHWETHEFPQGEAKKPITGIRGIDADKFCQWLTSKYGEATLDNMMFSWVSVG